MDKPSPDQVARRLIILKYLVVQAFVAPPPLRAAFKNWPSAEQDKIRTMLRQKSEQLAQSLRGLGIWEFMTDVEVKFFSTNPLDLTEQEIVNASWRLEAVMVFLWALTIIPEIESYDRQAKFELIAQIPSTNTLEFISGATLCDKDLLNKRRDLAELWHWRSRTRELVEKGAPTGVGGRSFDSIVRTTAVMVQKQGDMINIIDEDFPIRGKAYRDLSEQEWAGVRSIAIERHFALNWICGLAPDNDWARTPTDT